MVTGNDFSNRIRKQSTQQKSPFVSNTHLDYFVVCVRAVNLAPGFPLLQDVTRCVGLALKPQRGQLTDFILQNFQANLSHTLMKQWPMNTIAGT